jgi:hypothetical protein
VVAVRRITITGSGNSGDWAMTSYGEALTMLGVALARAQFGHSKLSN